MDYEPSVARFTADCIEQDRNRAYTWNELYGRYTEYCDKFSLFPTTSKLSFAQQLYEALDDVGIEYRKTRITVEEYTQKRAVQGVDLNEVPEEKGDIPDWYEGSDDE